MTIAGNSHPSLPAPGEPSGGSAPPLPEGQEEPPFSLAGFLIKLILLPAGVVALFVAVAVLFSWVTLSPKDLDDLATALERPGRSRWQAAFGLANLLANPQDQQICHDRELALRLCAILQRELDHPRPGRESVLLRVYLCRAVGEFRLPEVLPVLLQAASDRATGNRLVRRSAVEALAVVAHNLDSPQVADSKQLLSVLTTAAGDADADLRSTAAYALGVVGGRKAQEVLVPLLDDGDRNVRYNAANALARNGDPRALPVLMEMLELADARTGEAFETTGAQPGQSYRDRVAINAIRALGKLLARAPEENTPAVRARLQRLASEHVAPPVRLEALDLLRRWECTTAGNRQE